jgi:AcrR family transcriptional regulator
MGHLPIYMTRFICASIADDIDAAPEDRRWSNTGLIESICLPNLIMVIPNSISRAVRDRTVPRDVGKPDDLHRRAGCDLGCRRRIGETLARAVKEAASVRVDLARIRQAACILANRHGIDGLSMNELAQALNVRTPSLYSHVAGIDDVKRVVALHGLEELDRGAARATIGKSGPDAVRSLLTGYRDFVRRNPGVYAATLAPREDAQWRAAINRLKETCVAALQSYGLKGDEAIHALRGLRSVVHGFVSLEAAGALKDPVSRDASFAWLVESFVVMLDGAAARPRGRRE